MSVEAIIGELGRQMNLPLKLDGDGSCRIIIEDRYNIDIDAPAERPENVYIHAEVGSVTGGDDAALLRQLLAANLFGRDTGDATLALDEKRGQILLQRILSTDGLDYRTFSAALERLINAAMTWTEKIASAAQGATKPDDAFGGDVSHMIRI